MTSSTLFCDTCGAANQSQAVYCRSCGHSLQVIKPTIYHSATGRLLANILLKQQYRIIAPIGKGGMGAVYQAEDTQLGNRKVAIKEMSQSSLSPQEQKEAADAFRQEAMMLARLQHRNLPSIFDHFEENGRWYLVMSFIEGETLADYLSHTQSGKLPLDEAVQIGMQLCTVLSYLHTQQPPIIFRDLKPTNIMHAPDGHIYLIDFGIARHFKPGQAKDTAYYGSMGYAPPEQYGKTQTTPRSDIYSLGVVLHQLLSGHDPSTAPFQLPSLQLRVPAIPPQLVMLIMQMLELDEHKRPASMSVVKQKLQSIMTALSDLARLPMPLTGGGKSATPTTVAARASTMFSPVSHGSTRGTKVHGRTLLIGVLGVIIVTGLIYFAFSHQTLSGNNPNQTQIVPVSQTQSATPTAQPPTPTPIPTATPVPTTTLNLFPPNAVCKAGQGVGWNGWNLDSTWFQKADNSLNVEGLDDRTDPPSLIGRHCTRINNSSMITVTFTINNFGDGGGLWLKVQASSGVWYSVAFLEDQVRIQQDYQEFSFPYTLIVGQQYTFSMQISLSGINLLGEDGLVITTQPLFFTPTGAWGLRSYRANCTVWAVYVR